MSFTRLTYFLALIAGMTIRSSAQTSPSSRPDAPDVVVALYFADTQVKDSLPMVVEIANNGREPITMYDRIFVDLVTSLSHSFIVKESGDTTELDTITGIDTF